MDGDQQTEGETLFQQASQSHQPEVLVKRQFEQCSHSQKNKLANEFVAAAGREGLNQLAATPDGQHALAVVYDHAGSDGRGTMRQVHEEQRNTAVDYTPESGLVCTVQSAQEVERSPEEQYLDKLTKQYADHKSGDMPLPPSESLRLRSEIERVSEIVNPGQDNIWGDYTPQEKQYLEDQALKERQRVNNLGMWYGGPVFSALPVLGRVLGAPEQVVENLSQINADMAGGKAFGRQGRGIPPVRPPLNGGVVKAYAHDGKSVKIERPGSMVQGLGALPSKGQLLSRDIDSLVGNKLGSGSVGDFTRLENASFNEVLSRIPKNAEARLLVPNPKVQIGTEFRWTDKVSGDVYKVRIHGPDSTPDLPVGANSRHGWVTIVEKEIPKPSGGKQRTTYNPVSGQFEDKITFIKSLKIQDQLPASQRGLHLDKDPVNLSHMPTQVPHQVRDFLIQRTSALYP